MVEIETIADKTDTSQLQTMLEKHFHYTNSVKAKSVLENWNESVFRFVKVIPVDYKLAMANIARKSAQKDAHV